MSNEKSREPETDALQYRIGVAARLSGVATHTLRKWEERYSVVRPARTASGERMYSEEQVRYLGKLKALTGAGMEISELAGLSEEELEAAALAILPGPGLRPSESPRPRVFAVGPSLPEFFRRHAAQLRKLDVQGLFADAGELGAAGPGSVDLLVYEELGVHAATAETVARLRERSGARAALVLYRFGPRWVLDRLRSANVGAVRMPVQPGDLQRLALGTWYDVTGWPHIALGAEDGSKAAPPRFSESSLLRISTTSVAMRCECPHHIADLLLSITAFERYSAECEVQQPADAAEHRFLRATAASARLLLEQALVRLARAEGIALEEGGGSPGA